MLLCVILFTSHTLSTQQPPFTQHSFYIFQKRAEIKQKKKLFNSKNRRLSKVPIFFYFFFFISLLCWRELVECGGGFVQREKNINNTRSFLIA